MKTILLLSMTVLEFITGAFSVMAQYGPEQKITVSFTFGTDISINDDLAVISAGWENTVHGNKAGAVYVFKHNGIQWVQEQRIINEQGSYDAIFGHSVATNGEYIVITEPNRQSAHIYSYDYDAWKLDTIITVTDVSSEKYGISCDIDGNTVVIGSGAVFATYCTAVGSAYVYELDGAEWVNTAILSPSNPASHDGFATNVDIDGDQIAVGAPNNHCYAGDEGYVCIFEKNGTNWQETAKLFAPDGVAGNVFGYHVGLENNKLVVSSSGSQSIYCFEKNADWEYVETITSPNPAGGDGFGQTVSISDNRILIGASSDDTQFTNQGAAYMYEYNGTNWVERDKILPDSSFEDMKFGNTLGLDRNVAMLGQYSGPSVYAYPLGDPPCQYVDTIFLTMYDTVQIFDTIPFYDTIPVYDSIAVTDTLIIDAVLTGIDPPENINTLKVYPNPARDHIVINTGDYTRMNGYSIKIINQLGASVFETKIVESQYNVNLSTWTGKGLYFIQVIDTGGYIIDIRKIIIQ